MLVQAPLCLVVNEATRRRVRCAKEAVDVAVDVEQLVEIFLSSREDLLRKRVDEEMGKLSQLRFV